MSDLPAGMTTSEELVPGWLVRLAAIGWRVLAIFALGVAVLAVVSVLSTVAASIIWALVVAAALAPYVSARRARGSSRAAAASVVYLAALLAFAVVVVLVIVAVVPALSAILDLFRNGLATGGEQLRAIGVPSDVVALLERASEALRSNMVDGLGAFVASAANVVTIAILGGFLVFFLLMDGDKSWDWLLASTDGWRRDALMDGGRRALDQVGSYVRGTSVTAVATGALAAVLLTVLGVPYAGALAVIVLIGSFVPYVGRPLSAFLIVMIALATIGAVLAAILLVLFLVGMQAIDRSLARIASGRRLRMHPLLAVIGLPLGLAIGGFGGLVVILPLLAVAETAAGVLITALGREPAQPKAAIPSPATPVEPNDGPVSAPGDVPVWLDRLAQWSWRALVVAVLFGVLAQIALQFPGVIMPVVMAVILGATLAPVAARLQQRGLSRTGAALAVTGGTGIALIAILVFTIAALVVPMSDVVSTAQVGADGSVAGDLGIGAFVASLGVGLLATMTNVITNILGIVVVLLLGGFLTYFFIRDGDNVWAALVDRIPSDRRATLDDAGGRAAEVLGGYMIGTAAISAFGAATQWLIMVILGLPLALPLAVLALFAGSSRTSAVSSRRAWPSSSRSRSATRPTS